jgi:hypothetical protein
MSGITFLLAGLPIDPDPLPTLVIELTVDKGLVLTFSTAHSFSSQILEQCQIGNLLTMTVGNLSASGTVFEITTREDYSKIVLINILGIV